MDNKQITATLKRCFVGVVLHMWACLITDDAVQNNTGCDCPNTEKDSEDHFISLLFGLAGEAIRVKY